MARDLDRLYVILPFEAKHYQEVDLTVDYMGHPLADAIPHPRDNGGPGLDAAGWRSQCGLPAEGADHVGGMRIA